MPVVCNGRAECPRHSCTINSTALHRPRTRRAARHAAAVRTTQLARWRALDCRCKRQDVGPWQVEDPPGISAGSECAIPPSVNEIAPAGFRCTPASCQPSWGRGREAGDIPQRRQISCLFAVGITLSCMCAHRKLTWNWRATLPRRPPNNARSEMLSIRGVRC